MNTFSKEIKIHYTGADSRIDLYLSEHLEGLTRSRIAKLIQDGLVLVEGKKVKASTKVKEGSLVVVHIPEPSRVCIRPEPIPINIVFEDDFVIVVDKPPGMVVHPSAGHYSGTLVHALMHHCKSLSPIGGMERPGIVHRLDKDTSGLLIAAKEEKSHHRLCRQLQDRTVSRKYYAMVHGIIKEDSGIIETEIGRHPTDRKRMWVNPKKGKKAVSEFEVIERFKGFTMCEVRLKTGRTHQIRVHFAHKGYPIIGDKTYGKKKTGKSQGEKGCLINRQALHAYKLGFKHPHSEKYLEFESSLPEDMRELKERLSRIS